MSQRALVWPVYRLKEHPVYGDRLALVESLNADSTLVALHWLPPYAGASMPFTPDDIEEVGTFSLGDSFFPFDLDKTLTEYQLDTLSQLREAFSPIGGVPTYEDEAEWFAYRPEYGDLERIVISVAKIIREADE